MYLFASPSSYPADLQSKIEDTEVHNEYFLDRDE